MRSPSAAAKLALVLAVVGLVTAAVALATGRASNKGGCVKSPTSNDVAWATAYLAIALIAVASVAAIWVAIAYRRSRRTILASVAAIAVAVVALFVDLAAFRSALEFCVDWNF